MLVAPSISTSCLLLLSLYLHPICARAIASQTNLSRSKEARGSLIGNHWKPAPTSEDGHSLSARAIHDEALLPYQISGIVGSYLLVLCFVAVGIFFIRRKHRRQSLEGDNENENEIELVETHLKGCFNTRGFEHSPTRSPGASRNFTWPSPTGSPESHTARPYVFPTTFRPPPSLATGNPLVDDQVVQADREMLNRDLEDIYAHVMEQEEAKVNGIILKEAPLPLRNMPPPPPPPVPQTKQNTLHKKPSRSWLKKSKPANLNLEEGESSKSQSRSSSLLSALRSPGRKTPKPMHISSPLATPRSGPYSSNDDDDDEPLTPKYYNPPPPPPVPRDQAPYVHARKNSSGSELQPRSPTRSIAAQLAGPTLPQSPRPFGHRLNTSQTSTSRSSQGSQEPASATSATSQTPLVATHNASQAALAIPRSLPFRQFDPPASPSVAPQYTKTTVLERANPRSPGLPSGLRTPWSAGAVPYSPYQPFSPVLPMTPTLVTKEERKARQKAEKKKPVLELIKSDDELWDSGY